MIKKTILSLCFLALCLLGIFSYVSYRSFNTEAFKEQIIQAVQTVTGRTLTIKGNYKLVWNPLPTMTLEQTTLSNIANSPNPDMFNAEKIQIQIEWSSLFSSPIRIKNVIIVKPRILIERISRSTTNLQFPILLAARDVLDTDITLEGQSSAKIDNIQIEDGELRYVNQIYKTTHILSDINGNLTMGALNGPFGFEGTANFNNIPFKIKSSLGAHEVAQTIDFITDISLSDTTAHLKIDAKFNSENPDSYLNGTLAFDIADPNTLLANLKKPLLPKKYNTTTIGSAGIELGSTKTVLSGAQHQPA